MNMTTTNHLFSFPESTEILVSLFEIMLYLIMLPVSYLTGLWFSTIKAGKSRPDVEKLSDFALDLAKMIGGMTTCKLKEDNAGCEEL